MLRAADCRKTAGINGGPSWQADGRAAHVGCKGTKERALVSGSENSIPSASLDIAARSVESHVVATQAGSADHPEGCGHQGQESCVKQFAFLFAFPETLNANVPCRKSQQKPTRHRYPGPRTTIFSVIHSPCLGFPSDPLRDHVPPCFPCRPLINPSIDAGR